MAEQTVIAATLKVDADSANTSVKTFKSQLKEANAELLQTVEKFGETSAEAAGAAKRVAELRDTMGDAKSLVDAFNPDRKFQAFSNTLRGVTGGFAALQGAIALTGVESEETQQTLLKLQGALALSEGVNNVLELKDTFKQLGTFIQSTTIFQKANNATTQAATAIQKLFGLSVDQTSMSFKLLKGAIAATGIGLAIVAIGEIVSITQEWTSATERQIEAQKELNEQTEKLANVGLKAEQDFLNRQEKLDVARAKARGATEQEIFKIQEQSQQSRIESQKRHQKELEGINDVAAEESKRQVKNLQTDLQVLQLNFEADQRKKAEEAEKKRQEEAKREREKKLAEEKAAREKLIQERESNEQQAQAQIRKLQLDNDLALIQDEDERRKQRVIRETEFERERIANLNLSAQTRLELLRQINANEAIELDKIAQENREKEAQHDRDRLQAGLDRSIAAMRAFAEEKKRDAEEQKAIDQVVFDNKVAIANATEGVLNNLSELFGRQTAAGKIAALAQIAINTAVGFVQGLRIAQQSAAATGPGAAYAFPIFYATQLAAVLAAASKAKGVLSSGNSGGGSVAGVGTSAPPALPQAPLTPAPQTVNTTLDQDSINNIGNVAAGGVNSIRAYVVEQDSAEAAARAARLQGAAVLGG